MNYKSLDLSKWIKEDLERALCEAVTVGCLTLVPLDGVPGIEWDVVGPVASSCTSECLIRAMLEAKGV